MTTATGISQGSLADFAYHALRDRLVMLDIPPGMPLNEGQLGQELNIGRTPIRESLKKLELDHLVVSYPRRGTFATRVDITDLAQISELRAVLEPLAARKAALVGQPGKLAELDALAGQVADLDGEPPDNRVLMQYDIDVHRLIYQATDNPHLEETLVRLGNLATRIWCLVLDRMPSVSEHIGEHTDLIGAIVARDGDRAAALASAHISNFEASIRSVL